MSALGAHTIGVQALDLVGCTIWSAQRRHEGSEDPVGGLLVEVIERVTEDGERQRAYRCLNPYSTRPRLLWSVLTEAAVDLETVEPPNTSRTVALFRRLCEEAAFSAPHKARRGPLMPEHAELVRDALRLVKVVLP